MLDEFKKIVIENRGLERDRSLVVGVSGGADSLCLLDLTIRAGFKPLVAHFDHRVRPDSQGDAEYVRQIAGDLGCEFVLGCEDVPNFSREYSLSLEEACRVTRYRFLFGQADRLQAQAVLVAHSADDQVETILMHLLRGSGISGLRGMQERTLPNPWSASIPLVRPLLGVWRSEILAYCSERGLQPITDETNQDPTYFRNRLRLELIPYLESFNPGVSRAVWKTAHLLQGEYQVLQEIVQQAWESTVRESGPGYIRFDLDSLASQAVAVQRHLVRRSAEMLRPGLRDVGFRAIEQALDFLADPGRPTQKDWIAGLRLLSEPGVMWIADWSTDLPQESYPRIPRGERLSIRPGEAIELEDGWVLSADMVRSVDESRQLADTNQDPWQAWLTLGSPDARLSLRVRKPGDRITPLGMPDGSIKVTDLMINQKVPRRARAGWPLVCVGEDIAWIPGLRLSHDFRLTDETKIAIHFWFIPPSAV